MPDHCSLLSDPGLCGLVGGMPRVDAYSGSKSVAISCSDARARSLSVSGVSMGEGSCEATVVVAHV